MSVTTITAHRSGRRYSPAEELFLAHQQQLLQFIADRLPVADYRSAPDPHLVEDLVQEAWVKALLGGLDNTDVRPGLDSELPEVLMDAARVAIYRHLTWQLAEEPAPSGVAALEPRVAA
ncbi:hypothetical protein QT196_38895 (plasmid) [Streptomyces sp. P9-2B-2]|uniref:hypothetical protein n=1 Tax=Streptomyces sp. P9-2B-2 TaxID=3057114 RepID=UPI0025B5F18A|nr:hypothetical protein [Streptomyces sp. P9-2B-2]WJY43232.1 hypothetical protein QT196_38895 [Streptomyces sp. P9-2B-2]